jgi:hypothetical protein
LRITGQDTAINIVLRERDTNSAERHTNVTTFMR